MRKRVKTHVRIRRHRIRTALYLVIALAFFLAATASLSGAQEPPAINQEEEDFFASEWCSSERGENAPGIMEQDFLQLGNDDFEIREKAEEKIFKILDLKSFRPILYCHLEDLLVIARRAKAAGRIPLADRLEIESRLDNIVATVETEADRRYILANRERAILPPGAVRPSTRTAAYKAVQQWAENGCKVVSVACWRIARGENNFPRFFEFFEENFLFTCNATAENCRSGVWSDDLKSHLVCPIGYEASKQVSSTGQSHDDFCRKPPSPEREEVEDSVAPDTWSPEQLVE